MKILKKVIPVLLCAFALCASAPGAKADDTASTVSSSSASTSASLTVKVTKGDWSFGLVSADVMQGWDIFKHQGSVYSRTGASVNLIQYKNLGMFAGLLAPTTKSLSNLGYAGGLQYSLDSTLKAAALSIMDELPWTISSSTKETISSALTGKVYGGWDKDTKGPFSGLGVGVKKVF